MKAREVNVMGASALAAYLTFSSSSDVSKCDVRPDYLDLLSASVFHSNLSIRRDSKFPVRAYKIFKVSYGNCECHGLF